MEHNMELTTEKMIELLSYTEKNDFPFSIEERQLAAKASADTWEAIAQNTIQPFDFKKS